MAKTFAARLAELGMSQSAAARFLQCNDRSVRHWIAGDNPPPFAAEMLLALMAEFGATPEEVRGLVGVPLPIVRRGRPPHVSRKHPEQEIDLSA